MSPRSLLGFINASRLILLLGFSCVVASGQHSVRPIGQNSIPVTESWLRDLKMADGRRSCQKGQAKMVFDDRSIKVTTIQNLHLGSLSLPTGLLLQDFAIHKSGAFTCWLAPEVQANLGNPKLVFFSGKLRNGIAIDKVVHNPLEVERYSFLRLEEVSESGRYWFVYSLERIPFGKKVEEGYYASYQWKIFDAHAWDVVAVSNAFDVWEKYIEK